MWNDDGHQPATRILPSYHTVNDHESESSPAIQSRRKQKNMLQARRENVNKEARGITTVGNSSGSYIISSVDCSQHVETPVDDFETYDANLTSGNSDEQSLIIDDIIGKYDTNLSSNDDEMSSMSHKCTLHQEIKQPEIGSKQDDDWLRDLLKKKEKEMKEKMLKKKQTNLALPDKLSTTEKEYTKEFKTFIADGIAVKNEISSRLLSSLDWIVSVSLGFSTEKDGYWPVIKVSPDMKTCKEIKNKNTSKNDFKKEAAGKLKQALDELYLKSWTQEELERTIEITEHYPQQSFSLCIAGEKITTQWESKIPARPAGHHIAHHRIDGIATCNINVQLTVGHRDQDVHLGHYTITALHTVTPYKDQFFRSSLPPLPTTNDQENDMYTVLDRMPPELTLIKAPLDEPDEHHVVPTLLKISLFPNEATRARDQMKSFKITLTTATSTTKHEANLSLGKIGLFLKTTEPSSYQQALVNDPELKKNNKIVKHPCNIDIAVLKCKDDTYKACSIEESLMRLERDKGIDLPQIRWLEPPSDDIEEWKGTVVFFKEGVVYKLSDRVHNLISSFQGHQFPNCSWVITQNHDNCEKLLQGFSGSPVFLMYDNSLRLVGSLVTIQNASLIGFSLEVIRNELLMHHTQHVIDELEEQPYAYQNNIAELDKAELDIKLKCLKNYRKLLEMKERERSLLPLEPLLFSELLKPSNNMDSRIVWSEIKTCTHRH